jgi:hypothetical protein
MLQIRPGDLIAVGKGDGAVLFAILTKQILFGGALVVRVSRHAQERGAIE